ncbi:uncharacterized protein BT62DRAFT_927148 [Guyanagaster necrorhizus]|uniref:Uncharacterized protein n=1 Tax=Guyanagaster necrorhizus TaxID=856835 RepID=A0A9P8AXP8_9AGAR|nr:uncharacterized protein BT62DRAFT_927148 [Guyanagaster necrorhizus MCA 3950]KAG7451446.1 hypothetical protein BT62DRAFT_927148 [Guyanagaster necrorhizus MCA 3950]
MNIEQVTFNERLQLLHLLQFSDHSHPSDFGADEDTKETLRALDVIASCIATGFEGELFAASLDPTTIPPTIILSKTGAITEEDKNFVSLFLDAFTSPDTRDFRQVFPVLFARCFMSMKIRMQNLYEAARRYLCHHTALLNSYQPLSFKEEFPHFHLLHPNHDDREFADTFHMLFADIEKVASSPFHRDFPVLSHANYTRLHVLSVIIASSRFISVQTDDVFSEKTKAADELRRCLERIKQYVGGVNTLIRRSRQVFPDGNIPVRWVASPSAAAERSVEMAMTPWIALKRLGFNFDAGRQQSIVTQFPSFERNWQAACRTRIHAKIAVLRYFHERGLMAPGRCAIGCSEECCWCCDQWMSRYNSLYSMRYISSSASTKIRIDWGMSGLVPVDFFIQEELGSSIKDRVITRRRKRDSTLSEKNKLGKIEESREDDV